MAQYTMSEAASIENLYQAAFQSSRGVKWKYTVQDYMRHVFKQILYAQHCLTIEKDVRKKLSYFTVCERGKVRYIAAPKFSERVIQKSIAQNILIPAIEPTFTPGCGANVKGRGTDYSLIRLKRQLADHYNKFGQNGYILLMDFSNYFGSINHEVIKRQVLRLPIDDKIKRFLFLQIERDGIEGLGLGSEPNQALAVSLPSPLDRLGERWPGIKYSGRYMDDSYYIAQDKQTLQEFLKAATSMCNSLGITINTKKTQIVKLSRGFVFLKKRFHYTNTGKIVVRPIRKNVTRARRKIKKLAGLVKSGKMTVEQAINSYASIRGSFVRKHDTGKKVGKTRLRMNTYKTVKNLDELFYDLMIEAMQAEKE